MKLHESIQPLPRFARSINVERDSPAGAAETYFPTGRALDVVRRISRSLDVSQGGRAFSITGPHGSGKSSLAVFISALLAPTDSHEFSSAAGALEILEQSTARQLREGRVRLDPTGQGFIRAIVAAQREPVIATVGRALSVGAARHFRGRRGNPVPADWIKCEVASALTPRDIRQALDDLARHSPIILLIDEFGKNLEAYADSGRDGDPYLLQELAEWASGAEGLPLIVVTMQHLAFEEYVHETSTARRREWVKVQGRFEDIAYVETPAQSRRLIASAFTQQKGKLSRAVNDWVSTSHSAFARAGLGGLIDELGATYPLHPTALAVLPDLCSRYGQNERTLFSFLAGPEPRAVPEFLESTRWSPGQELPFVRLSDVYDYFVASASTMISSASTGSRWVEIESRIRDTAGLDALQLDVLKSIGVLNLISAGGQLRASRQIVALSVADSPTPDEALREALRQLESRGLITYRDFADEYRIWQGSDFDLKAAIDSARRRCETRGLDDLLNEAAALLPLVAARHSQERGTLRVFSRRFSRLKQEDLVPVAPHSQWDGSILLCVNNAKPETIPNGGEKPVILVRAKGVEGLREAALDAAALADVLQSDRSVQADWVARRELIERSAGAQKYLLEEIARVFDAADVKWHLLGTDHKFQARQGPSRVISDIADLVYSEAPYIPNEMLARRELTSQGAKARRMLIESMLSKPASLRLGIQGFPAERAMYEAVLARPGIHRVGRDGTAEFHPPHDGTFKPAWNRIEKEFRRATKGRINLLEIWRLLQTPPIGLKDGPIPVLMIVALMRHRDHIALYEHGSLLLAIDDAVAERLVRNPGHFAVKNTGAETAVRRAAIDAIAQRLGYQSYSGNVTFLGVARHLYSLLRNLEPYAISTKTVSVEADAMRKAFQQAAEPDRLLFEELPKVFGLRPIGGRGDVKKAEVDAFVSALGGAIEELQSAYPKLLKTIETELCRALAESPEHVRSSFSALARPLVDSVLEPRLKSLVTAACVDDRDDKEWLEYIGMVVAEAGAPKGWNDETLERFRLAATELGGAFRRVVALITERRAIGSLPTQAVPIAVTRLDGRESRSVLWATTEEKQAVEGEVRRAIEEAASKLGSIEKARQVILASMLEGPPETDQVNDVASEKRRILGSGHHG